MRLPATGCSTRAGAVAPAVLSHGLVTTDLDALGHERGEPLGLVLGKVEVIPRVVLSAGEADREPTVAGSEIDIALDQGALGMGSGELCHDKYTKQPSELFQLLGTIGMGWMRGIEREWEGRCSASAGLFVSASSFNAHVHLGR